MSTDPYVMGKADSSWKDTNKARVTRERNREKREASRRVDTSSPVPPPPPKPTAPSPNQVVASLVRHPELALEVGKILSKLVSPWESFSRPGENGFRRRDVRGEMVAEAVATQGGKFFHRFPATHPDQQGVSYTMEGALTTCDATLQSDGWTLLGKVYEWPEDFP